MVSAEEYKLFAEASITNQAAAKYFGIAIGSLVGLFAISHWTQRLSTKLFAASRPFAQISAAVSRPFKRAATGAALGGILVFLGRTLLALVYFAINIVLTFTNVNWELQTLFAKRLGWMALCNLCLVVFLGLKNTPLSPLARKSYESINVLHRCCGYTTILYTILHSSIYITGLEKAGATFVLKMPEQYAAATAGLSMLVIFVSSLGFTRKRHYELFVTLHIFLVPVILAMVGFHVYQPPDTSPKTIIMVGLAAALWAADRSLRFSRWIYYGVGNYCTLTPLPEGATRVVMHRSIRAAPGSHVLLWIPGVKAFQMHPFTLVSNEPAEFVIAARNGFTRALFVAATSKPGGRMRAAIEGPYGQMPDVRDHNKVVLIAGGSGATFTIAMALHWARQIRLRKHRSTLDFIWTVKSRAYLQWFDVELAELRDDPAVNLRIHITGAKVTEKGSISGPLPLRSVMPAHVADKENDYLAARSMFSALPSSSSGVSGLSSVSEHGRPDVDIIVGRAVASVPSTKKVLVAASGPSGLLTDIRLAASTRMTADMPDVHLHLEEFGL